MKLQYVHLSQGRRKASVEKLHCQKMYVKHSLCDVRRIAAYFCLRVVLTRRFPLIGPRVAEALTILSITRTVKVGP